MMNRKSVNNCIIEKEKAKFSAKQADRIPIELRHRPTRILSVIEQRLP